MAIPKKTQDLQPSFRRYVLKEGGWKGILKVAIGIGIVGCIGYSLIKMYRQQKRQKLYQQGLQLSESGVKASDGQSEFSKCRVDTTKKVAFGHSQA